MAPTLLSHLLRELFEPMEVVVVSKRSPAIRVVADGSAMILPECRWMWDGVERAEIIRQLRSIDHDAALLVRLQPVDAADQGGLAGPGWTADHHPFLLRNSQRDVA